MTTVFANLDEVLESVGRDLGHSDWLAVEQDRINLFADATGDHQWIHIDAERAAAGPFGATIAHGYLTLSLVSCMLPQVLRVDGVSMGINYGVNRVRFPHPVTVWIPNPCVGHAHLRGADRRGRRGSGGDHGDHRDRRQIQTGLCGRTCRALHALTAPEPAPPRVTCSRSHVSLPPRRALT